MYKPTLHHRLWLHTAYEHHGLLGFGDLNIAALDLAFFPGSPDLGKK